MPRTRIVGRDWAEKDNKKWIVSIEDNAIMEIDNLTNEATFIGKYDDRINRGSGLSSHCVLIGSKIVFVPFNSSVIVIYDIEDKSFTRKRISPPQGQTILPYDGKRAFWEIAPVGEMEVMIFGRDYPAALRLNLKSMEMEYLTEWINLIPERYRGNKADYNFYFGNGYHIVSGELFIPSGMGAGIWKVSLSTNSFSYIDLPIDVRGFNHFVQYHDDKYLLIEVTPDVIDRLIIWERNTNKISEVSLSHTGYWNKPIIYQNDIYLLPWRPEDPIVLRIHGDNLNCDEFVYLEEALRGMEVEKQDWPIAAKQINDNLIILGALGGSWLTYDFSSGEITKCYYDVTDEEYMNKIRYDNVFYGLVNQNRPMNEHYIPLNEFIKRVP